MSFINTAQQTIQSTEPDSLVQIVPSSYVQPAAEVLLTSQYLEILEKTNQQLSFIWNPYGVMVASLGVLFAVLGIIAAFVIYRQGNSYQKLVEVSIARHKSVLDSIINERVEALKIQMIEAIGSKQKEAQDATGASRDEIDSKIAELQDRLNDLRKPYEFTISDTYPVENFWTGGASITSDNDPSNLAKMMRHDLFSAASHKCAKCGASVDRTGGQAGKSFWEKTKVACPKCGNVELC